VQMSAVAVVNRCAVEDQACEVRQGTPGSGQAS
jgi:hypothetical protein